MKKLLALLLTLAIVFSFAACAGGGKTDDAATPTDETTATDGVNVRSEGSTNGTVLATLYPGQEVNVVGSEGGWTHINFTSSVDGSKIDGYVSSDYLSFQ